MSTATLLVPPATPTPPAASAVTAEEFVEHYSHRYAELIDGILVEYSMPSGRHGEVCAELTRLMGNFVKDWKLGRVLSHDTHILMGLAKLSGSRNA